GAGVMGGGGGGGGGGGVGGGGGWGGWGGGWVWGGGLARGVVLLQERGFAVGAPPSVRRGVSEPAVLHFHAGLVAGFEQVQLVVAGGHFPGQEVAGGLQLAAIEGFIRSVAAGQAL